MKINTYLIGFFLILALPLLVIPPYFAPTDWGKTIVFRSILAILLFVFTFQFLYRKNELNLPNIKNNKIIWVLGLFFIIVILATLFSQDITFSLWGSPYRSGGAVDVFFYITFAVLLFLIVKPEDWKKLFSFSIFVGIIVCLIALIQFYGLFSNVFVSSPGRPPSTMGNPIMLGIYLLLLLFPTLSLAVNQMGLKPKLFYYSSALLFLYVILITGSRAAYLGILTGGVYFGSFYLIKYRKKLWPIIIALVIATALGGTLIYFASTKTKLPSILENNKLIQSIYQRLSLNEVLIDPRFSAWQVVIKEIGEKPILGWGPENLAIGFDKYYSPSLPYINKAWGGWWDRAHNVFLETAATTGIPSVIIYLALFIILFWQLQKIKDKRLYIHGIQATLIAYVTASFFAFDTFSTYILFFLIIGYSLSLTTKNISTEVNNINNQKPIKAKGLIMFILSASFLLFIWQYNILPLQINAQINKSDNLADNNKCDLALLIAEKNISKNHSFLDAYAVIHYIESIQKCATTNPGKNLDYAKKGAEVMKKAVKIRPLYSRLWIFLGSFTTIKASVEQDLTSKEALLKEAGSYFEKATQLAPNHQEILVEWAKLDMVAGDYGVMKEKAEKCISLDQSLGDCYWIKALSEIYSKNFTEAEKNIDLAGSKMLDNALIPPFLKQMANAYAVVKNYKDLVATYEKLIISNPNIAEYHSSIAFAYAQLGQYKKAREQAMIFLQLMPEAKEEVNLFLKTLPY